MAANEPERAPARRRILPATQARLAAAVAALVVLVLLIGGSVAERGLRAREMARIERELSRNAHLIGEHFREHYAPGFVNCFYQYHPDGMRPTRLEYVGEVRDGVQRYGTRHAELADDYRRALADCPLTLAKVSERIARLRPGQPEPRLTCYGIGLLGYSQTLSIDAARRALRYSPAVSIDEGIGRYARWCAQ